LEEYNSIKNRIVTISGRPQQEKSALDIAQSTTLEAKDRLRTRQSNLQDQVETLSKAVEALDADVHRLTEEVRCTEEEIQDEMATRQALMDKVRGEGVKRDEIVLRVNRI